MRLFTITALLSLAALAGCCGRDPRIDEVWELQPWLWGLGDSQPGNVAKSQRASALVNELIEEGYYTRLTFIYVYIPGTKEGRRQLYERLQSVVPHNPTLLIMGTHQEGGSSSGTIDGRQVTCTPHEVHGAFTGEEARAIAEELRSLPSPYDWNGSVRLSFDRLDLK